jgi:nicotinamidase-related amidase
MNNETALLVMDYQHGIIGHISDSKALIERARKAIEIARGHGATVGYVRVAFDEKDIEALPDRNKMRAAIAQYGDAIRNDSPATAIHEDIAPQPGDIVVRKTRVGPFTTTDLEQQLRDRGITTLVLAGISTSGVVLSTVREAADLDYRLFVLADACADTAQDVHECLIEKVFPRQADVITVDELEQKAFG